ncbi:carbohydrate kinase domain containing protein [Echinococcus multilocularis]|uniref:ATP-dependent (S)-NAD(P)H-hydrate dehydratase n=1 Tax=Echinococcus multilocularis TaxID=6211 RepID=A0A068XXG3_ECHMU|nr:carbohydrate kinase domain containing protein [Echinococcus multilocularis]
MGDMLKIIREVIPPLNNAMHKGQMGRWVYTGAPYFAAITALSCGADLVHVICAASAAQAIKCYSPELIVHPTLDNDLTESEKWASKMHSLVIGPGLGVSENVLYTIEIMKECRIARKPMVIDADGIFVVAKNRELVSGYKSVILTPNVNEFSLLYKTIFGTGPSDDPQETSKLAAALGNLTIIRKGPKDIISDGENLLFCDMEGSPRRCGGQGDLLSGAAAVFSHWLSEKPPVCSPSGTMVAGLAACMLARRCAGRAFSKYGRSTVTTKMIDEIATAFDELFGT